MCCFFPLVYGLPLWSGNPWPKVNVRISLIGQVYFTRPLILLYKSDISSPWLCPWVTTRIWDNSPFCFYFRSFIHLNNCWTNGFLCFVDNFFFSPLTFYSGGCHIVSFVIFYNTCFHMTQLSRVWVPQVWNIEEEKESHLSVSFMTISILPKSWQSALEFFENRLFLINKWCHYFHLLTYVMSQWTSVQILSTAFPMCSFYIICLNIALNGLPGICLHGTMYSFLFLYQSVFLQMDYNLIAC